MTHRERQFRTPAIILKRFDLGEADRLLTLLTPRHGKIEVVAKGARKLTSAKTGHVELFTRADMLDTKIDSEAKDDAAMVAKTGFEAMMKGEGDVVSGLKNKIQSAVANVTPAERLAKQHRKMAEPGTAKS